MRHFSLITKIHERQFESDTVSFRGLSRLSSHFISEVSIERPVKEIIFLVIMIIHCGDDCYDYW